MPPIVCGIAFENGGNGAVTVFRAQKLASPGTFYRFSSARPTRILEQRVFPDRVILDYGYEPLTGLRLQGETSLAGPYVDVTNVSWNPTNRTFSLPQTTPFTAFRVVGDHLEIILRTSTVDQN